MFTTPEARLFHRTCARTWLLAGTAALVISTGLAGRALADDVPTDDEDDTISTMETMTVTARRRTESILDVPIAVSSFSGDQLEAIGAMDLTDIEAITPNVTLETSRGTNTTITAFIRGVGQQDPVAGFEAGVGIYIDDIYLNRPQAALLDIYDVERIEVLRGPQGTLYGRNTIGGAVKYVTRRLTNELEAGVRATGGTFGQFDIVGKFGIPVLVDSGIGDLQVGGTIGYFRRNGFGDNLNIEGIENYQRDVLAGRVTVEWEPTSTFSLRIAGDWTDDNSDPRQGHRLLDFPGFPVLEDVFDTRAGLNNPIQSVVSRGVSAIAEWQVTERITLKNIIGYRDDESASPIDFDSLPLVDVDVPVIYLNDQFSQEFQVLYDGDRFNALGGVYYLNADASNEFDVLLGTSTPIFVALGLIPPTTSVFNSFTFGDVNTETWSVFGNFTYDLTDTITLEFGARYTNDERTASVQRLAINGPSPAFGGVTPPELIPFFSTTPDFTGNETFREFDPRASITWQPTEQTTFYASYAQGFKGGGFDPRGATVAAPDLDGDGVGLSTNGVADPDDEFEFLLFEPEEITTYEVGTKLSYFDGRLFLNISGFFSDYEDVQIPGSIGVDADGDGIAENFAGITTNAAEATLFGVEVDGYAVISQDLFKGGDSIRWDYSLGYINTEFDEFIGATGEDISDVAVFQNTPSITAYSMMTYSTPAPVFGYEGTFSSFLSASYRSFTNQFAFASPIDQPEFVLFNAGVAWNSEDGRWTLSVTGTNLLDKEYIVAGYDFVTAQPAFANAPLGTTGVLTGFFGNPRQVFGTVEFNF
ncbi:MAG: TonB-dependent receptor [Pseudomonadota bacterium]